MFFRITFKSLLFYVALATEFSNLDKSHTKHYKKTDKSYGTYGGQLNKHFSKIKIQILPMSQQKLPIYTFPFINQWKL